MATAEFSWKPASKVGWTNQPGTQGKGEAEDIKKWQEYTEELYQKDLCDPDNHDRSLT